MKCGILLAKRFIKASHVWKDVWHVLLFQMHVISDSNSPWFQMELHLLLITEPYFTDKLRINSFHKSHECRWFNSDFAWISINCTALDFNLQCVLAVLSIVANHRYVCWACECNGQSEFCKSKLPEFIQLELCTYGVILLPNVESTFL